MPRQSDPLGAVAIDESPLVLHQPTAPMLVVTGLKDIQVLPFYCRQSRHRDADSAIGLKGLLTPSLIPSHLEILGI